MPKLHSHGWVGDLDCNQGILDETKRNKVVVYRPYDTLFASFVVKKDASPDTWITTFAKKIEQSWTIVMVAAQSSKHRDINEIEVEFVLDVAKNENSMMTIENAHEFGHMLIESLSCSDVTLYSEYVLCVKVA